MDIKEKILLDIHGLKKYGPINIVVFGDSVSHGAVNGYFDYENVYWNLLKQKLHNFRDFMPINMLNASICGTTASSSLDRMENQVFAHNPDLIVVCFGLNDVNGTLENYLKALTEIFDRCIHNECQTIFLTPNMLNTYVADDTPKEYIDYARKTAEIQNSGRMDSFIYAAINLAESKGITVCDCYSKWKELSKTEDTTLLLANRINHPTSEMHKLFADELYTIIMGNNQIKSKSDSAMFIDAEKNETLCQ